MTTRAMRQQQCRILRPLLAAQSNHSLLLRTLSCRNVQSNNVRRVSFSTKSPLSLQSFSPLHYSLLSTNSRYSIRTVTTTATTSTSSIPNASSTADTTATSSRGAVLGQIKPIRIVRRRIRWTRIVRNIALVIGGTAVAAAILAPTDAYIVGIGALRVTRDIICVVRMVIIYAAAMYGFDGDDPLIRQSALDNAHWRAATVLKDTFNANGGIYIKFGQTLATMSYLLPEQYPASMQSMLSAAPITPWSDVKSTVEESLGKPIESVFLTFDQLPIASASLAQVHFATLHSGEQVAVKVQHRSLHYTVKADCMIVTWIVSSIRNIFPSVDYTWLTTQMRECLPAELNFRVEAANADETRSYFAHRDDVTVPLIYHDCSSDRVLVMQRISGHMVSDTNASKALGLSLSTISQLVSEVFSEMIFVHGFVHADPHPGNIWITKNPNTSHPQLILLDHGLYTRLPDDFRLLYAKLWRSLIMSDSRSIEQYAREMNCGELYPLFAAMLTRKSWDEIKDTNLDHLQATHSNDERARLQIYAAQYGLEIQRILAVLPKQMILLLKTNECLRHIDSMLHVPFNSFIVMARYCTLAINTQRWNDNPTMKTAVWNTYERSQIELRVSIFESMMFVRWMINQIRYVATLPFKWLLLRLPYAGLSNE